MKFQPLKKQTLNKFSLDYEDISSISQSMIDFDRKLIEFFNNRKDRFANFEFQIDEEEHIGSIDVD